MRSARPLRSAPPITGGVVLRPPRPAAAPAPAPALRPFRITIEGLLASNGQFGLSRLDIEGDPARPLQPLEAEAICRRILFAPPAVGLAALPGAAPPSATEEAAPTDAAPEAAP